MTQEKLWEKAIIVFDTSAIIELYFYSDRSLDYIIDILFDKLENRLYITNQINLEYLKHKDNKKEAASLRYNQLKKIDTNQDGGYLSKITAQIKSIKGIIKTLCDETGTTDKHPWIEKNTTNPLLEIAEDFKDTIDKQISLVEEKIDLRVSEIKEAEDKVFKAIRNLFKIGEETKFSEKLKIAKEGKFRYDMKIPPGYMDGIGDNAKEGLAQFGDLFIWHELINISIEKALPIILVSNDLKIDWCIKQENNNKRIESPRIELLEEFHEKTNCKFQMYSLSQFLFESQDPLGIKIPKEANIYDDEFVSITVPLIATNHQSSFWGYSTYIEGNCIISEMSIEIEVQKIVYSNRMELVRNLKELTVNISRNTSSKWEKVAHGLPIIINKIIGINEQIELNNLRLSVSRKEIRDLDGFYLTFSTYSTNETKTGGGWTHVQWNKLIDLH